MYTVDIDADRLAETQQQGEGTVRTQQADVSDPAACAGVVAACVEELGGLDVLGNVAGMYFVAHTTDVTLEQYRRIMGVNLDACFFLAQAAIPHLLERGGNIVNIASNAGLQGVPYSVAYCMSKGGVVQLTRALAVEYLKTRLRVTRSRRRARTRTFWAPWSSRTTSTSTSRAAWAGSAGMAEPGEVAALFAFLASDEARSVTGAIYTVDNGLTAS